MAEQIQGRCHVCGGRGWVLRRYVEPNCTYQEAHQRVPCRKCSDTVGMSYSGHWALTPSKDPLKKDNDISTENK